jgi:galactokinase
MSIDPLWKLPHNAFKKLPKLLLSRKGVFCMIDANQSIRQLVEQAAGEFEQSFGNNPRWVAAAPGRVNLIGEHTDYNDGFVLPMAIERYVVVAAAPYSGQKGNGSNQYRAKTLSTGELRAWPVSGPAEQRSGDWVNYVWGILAECRKEGLDPGPLDLVIESNVPVGGGLSSSAALEVAMATMVEAATGQTLPPVDKALLCQRTEHRYAGVPCGIMDQFSSVMGREGHLILLDCRSTKTELVPLTSDEVTVLIINSNVKHELSGGEYAERRQQCEKAAEILQVDSLRDCTIDHLMAHQHELEPVLLRRARHVVTEIERTTAAVGTMRAGDWRKTGELMAASHESLRVDYEVSCDELDLLVQLAQQIDVDGGVFGSRMTGGGFGGCTVSLVDSKRVPAVAELIYADYQQKTGITPSIFVSRPAQGAHIVAPAK